MANAHLSAGLGVADDNRGSVGFGFNEVAALHLHDSTPGCERSQIGRVSRFCGDCWNLVFKIPNLAFGEARFSCHTFILRGSWAYRCRSRAMLPAAHQIPVEPTITPSFHQRLERSKIE
ncbi:hypothetical protein H2N78_06995 [Pseudomonas aeruginosa]|uniref:hypothetical protein n=1 Tax=Pseudomonas aeruginosa TaxID=287 RepID=UPI00141BD25F|nr:hypothetical protein [Pseudomonas aeruginosa]MBA5116990.1 hypothetical protein [Pseudomonas aeruginosa]HBO9019080.1 hypothetical protein [Pseudomonas aeruginosa]HEH9487705.1 hypothetical protein [Pseudomonas aeruginosa]HEP8074119.1 hypothetical protein [Pseudomonas aeruginosa]